MSPVNLPGAPATVYEVTLRFPDHPDPWWRKPHKGLVIAGSPENAGKKAAALARQAYRHRQRLPAAIDRIRVVDEIEAAAVAPIDVRGMGGELGRSLRAREAKRLHVRPRRPR